MTTDPPLLSFAWECWDWPQEDQLRVGREEYDGPAQTQQLKQEAGSQDGGSLTQEADCL